MLFSTSRRVNGQRVGEEEVLSAETLPLMFQARVRASRNRTAYQQFDSPVTSGSAIPGTGSSSRRAVACRLAARGAAAGGACRHTASQWARSRLCGSWRAYRRDWFPCRCTSSITRRIWRTSLVIAARPCFSWNPPSAGKLYAHIVSACPSCDAWFASARCPRRRMLPPPLEWSLVGRGGQQPRWWAGAGHPPGDLRRSSTPQGLRAAPRG